MCFQSRILIHDGSTNLKYAQFQLVVSWHSLVCLRTKHMVCYKWKKIISKQLSKNKIIIVWPVSGRQWCIVSWHLCWNMYHIVRNCIIAALTAGCIVMRRSLFLKLSISVIHFYATPEIVWILEKNQQWNFWKMYVGVFSLFESEKSILLLTNKGLNYHSTLFDVEQCWVITFNVQASSACTC